MCLSGVRIFCEVKLLSLERLFLSLAAKNSEEVTEQTQFQARDVELDLSKAFVVIGSRGVGSLYIVRGQLDGCGRE